MVGGVSSAGVQRAPHIFHRRPRRRGRAALAAIMPLSPPPTDAARRREVASVVVHVALFAQLGVAARAGVDAAFGDGCTGGWGACLTSLGAAD